MFIDKKTPNSKVFPPIANSLIAIFDNRDLFSKEYQQLLAAKIISSIDPFHNLVSELASWERLRKEFGSQMQHIDVMLRDMIISQDINDKIQSDNATVNVIGLLLCS